MIKYRIRTFKGIPKQVKWVSKEYQTNRLSKIDGGSDIIIQYQDGNYFGYERIKYPSNYISEILASINGIDLNEFESYDDEDQLFLIENKIQKIFLRESSFFENYFKKIWDSKLFSYSPLKILKQYDYVKKVKPTKKADTVLQTLELFELGKTIKQISKIRDLTEGTIINHLIKISDEYGKSYIGSVKPSNNIVKKVRNAVKYLGDDKLTPIYQELNE
ncbi:MAG: helix-turn-helix domain-containing protein [Chitinophagaceae bacterium]|nr:helix-turn-helix domain-containing protein [Chitinophagaceae bacterium]